jgi:hypothetical protein
MPPARSRNRFECSNPVACSIRRCPFSSHITNHP